MKRTPLGRTCLALLAASSALVSTYALAADRTKPKNTGQETAAKEKPRSEVVPASGDAPGGATVNLGSTTLDRSTQIYYPYKGVYLPLKKYLEYQGSNPFVEIVDGKDVLWVAKRGDVYRLLDRVLYAQLDTMTGAADDLYERHRFPAAYRAYKDVLDVLTNGQNDLKENDLDHYPAVKSYLLYRMGQARDFEALGLWNDSERLRHNADDESALAAKRRRIPDEAVLAPANDQNAAAFDADAVKLATEAAALEVDARRLLSQAASQNDRLWQAHNELGILAMAAATRADAEGDADTTDKELKNAEDEFKKAKTQTDAKEIVDSNLVAVYSTRADALHSKGKFGDALDLLRQAMELVPDQRGAGDVSGPVSAAPESFEVSFSGWQPARGERIVIRAEAAAAIARKYLEIERDRRIAASHPVVAEAETAVPTRWRTQGERLLKKKRWRASVAFYTALYDQYVAEGSPAADSVPTDFKDHIRKSVERAFGERANVLVKSGRDDDALRLYGLALQYVPNSRVLLQAQVLQALRHADNALSSARWEEAISLITPIYETVYKPYDGNDPEKTKTRTDLAIRLGTAYVGLTRGAMDRGRLDQASKFADQALALFPSRSEWKENKARVLLAQAVESEKSGNLEGAADLYAAARTAGAGPIRIRAAFARDRVLAMLFVPKARRWVVAETRTYGWIVALVALITGVGVPATRASLSASSRRRRATSLRDKAQEAYDAKQWNEAVDLFNDYFANVVGAADPESFEYLARSYRKIGDYENALRYFERAASRMPGRKFNLERAEIYLVRRNLPLALQALRTSPSLASDAEKLTHFLNYLREKDGESVFVSEALAAIQMAAGDLDSARQIYLRLLEQAPANAKVLRALAELSRRAGNENDRRGYLEKLVKVETGDAIALRELGNLLAKLGELPGAIENLKKAQEVMPGEGLASRIAELSAELLVREAELEIERLSRELDTPSRRFRIGELHWRLGRVTEAKKFFEEAATLREYQARALRYLGLIALSEHHHEDAVSLLRGYLAKRTNLSADAPEKEARYALAQAYEALEDPENATQQYEAIFEADPSYKDVSRKVKAQLASKRLASRGPVECPFCKKRVPGDAEFCPHCNFHLTAGGADAGMLDSDAGPLHEETTNPGDDPKKKP